jgi:hypothetical protein
VVEVKEAGVCLMVPAAEEAFPMVLEAVVSTTRTLVDISTKTMSAISGMVGGGVTVKAIAGDMIGTAAMCGYVSRGRARQGKKVMP